MQKIYVKPKDYWMNDPNGFIYYKGMYHLFYQCFPYAPRWGRMHWGHVVSKDLVNWEEQGIALFPSKTDDRSGCFSGSAIEEDGKMQLYYTGVNYLTENPEDINLCVDEHFVSAQLMITSEDGIHFDNIKDKKTVIPVIHDADIGDARHTRDPKVWKDGDIWYMVLGSTINDKQGKLLFFTSTDGEEWKFENSVTRENFGWMWECPDYFKIGDKKLLSTSVQGLEGGIWEDRNVYQSGYFEIEGDILGEYKLSEYHLWDYGFDYYAPQSFETEDGRRIHISWMGMPDCEEYSNPTIQTGWQHCFTFPREIFEKDGKICQRPIRELEEKKHLVSDVKGMLAGEGYPVYEMTISDITKNRFKVILSEKLILDYADGKFRMHFTDQDKTSVSSGRSMRYVEVEEVENLKILADTSSVEVFVNDGEYVFSTRYYPEVYKLQAEAVGAQITLSEIM